MSMLEIESTINGTRASGEDVRAQNVTACVALANIVKTSFGPTGLDKMLVDQSGDAVITNDGATILGRLEVEHPAAKVLVELAHLQDKEVGDGTTTVVILAAELLKRGSQLVRKKVHPTSIISGFRVAASEAVSYIESQLAMPVASLPADAVISVARTSMASKIIGHDEDVFAPLVVNALKRVGTTNANGETKYPVGAVKILKAIGKSQRDSTLIEGFALNCYTASPAMPRTVTKAKIALLDFGLEKTKMPHGVSYDITDPDQVALILKREENIMKERIELILKAGANVILTSKGIDDAAVKYLLDAKAMGVRRVEKEDLRNIAKATGGTILLNLANLEGEESFDPAALGEAESVSQEFVGEDEVIVIRGTKNTTSASILLRGANHMMLDEMERSVHDALSAVKRVLESGAVVPGGGAVEAALSIHLEKFAESLGTREQLAIMEFANALLVIPKILAVNSAKDANDLTAKLCTLHDAAQRDKEKAHYARFGLDLFEGKVRNNVDAGVLEPAMSKLKSIKFATEAAITILRIDDMIRLNPKAKPKDPHDDHDH